MNTPVSISPRNQTVPAAANNDLPVQETLLSDIDNEPLQRLPVQRKLAIGSPDDPLEHEADAVADKVMRMPVQGFIQRQCADCEEEEMIQQKPLTAFIQRKCTECEEEEKLQRKPLTPYIQAKGTESSTASDSITENINSTRGGGSSLESGTQSFMESRFGADFSDVRIHTGDYAAQMSSDINAQAFTVGKDIYFNSGKYDTGSDSGKHLLAHELTHVVQQGGDSIRQKSFSHSESHFIQRAYWVGYEKGKPLTGTALHKEILGNIGSESGNSDLFVEAPVPNADLLSADYGKHGSADFYKASTTVGIEFPAHFEPAFLEAPGKLRKGGKKFNHTGKAAPVFNGKINLANAPSSINIGDLKPYGADELDPKYQEQISNYMQGFEMVKKDIGLMATDPAQKNKLNPSGGTWSLTTGEMGSSDIKIPDRYKVGSTTVPSRRIILKDGSKKYFVKQKVTGKLYIGYRLDQKGIWNYFWVPDSPVTVAMLPPEVTALQFNMNALIDPLKDVNLQRKKIQGSLEPISKSFPEIRGKESDIVRKKDTVPNKKDSFSYPDWEGKWKDFNTKYKGTPETAIDEAQGQVEGRKTQSELSSKFGGISDGGTVSAKEKENIKLVKQLRLWSNPFSKYIGKLRQVFGVTFAKAYNVIEGIKAKVAKGLKSARKSFGGGFVGAVVKLLFKIFKIAGKMMIEKTVDLVLNSIIEGSKKKIMDFADNLVPDEVDEYVQKIKTIQEDFEKKVVGEVDKLLDTFVKPVMDKLEILKDIEAVANTFTTIINVIKWGARIIACASPPAIGCLWALAQSVLEAIAARVIDSCWFQKKVGDRAAEALMSINVVANIPVEAAKVIINMANGLLPAGWENTFPLPSTADLLNIKAGYDGSCDEAEGGGGGSDPFGGTRQKIFELIEEIGEDKFLALMELAQKRGAGPWVLLTEERLELLKGKLKEVTADQLRDAAKDTSKGTPVSLDDFLKDVKKYTPKEKKLIEKSAEDKKKKAELAAGKGKGAETGEGESAKDKGSGPSYEVIKGKIEFDESKAGNKSMSVEELTIKAKMEDVRSNNSYDAKLVLNDGGNIITIPDLKIKVEYIIAVLTAGEQPPPTYYITITDDIYIKYSTGELYKLTSMNISETFIKFSSP